MCSYSDENKDTVLLKAPAARILSGETDNAEIIPFDGISSLLVLIVVRGPPGLDNEKIETQEFVPHIRLR